MSLRIWLPLNGNLDNKGLDDVTITNNGATVNNSGKIGKCYSFGTGNNYLTVSPITSLQTFTEFSFACWVKIISWNVNYSTIFAIKNSTGASWNNLTFSLLRNAATSQLCFNIANGTSYTSTNCHTDDLDTGVWYHFVCTYETGYIKIYQNGILNNSYATNIVPNFSSILNFWIGKSNEGSYQSNILLNDVRVYDHALSKKEVKEISKGLIVHYPLNRNGWGQDNLLPLTDFNGISKKFILTSGTEGGFTFTPTTTITPSTNYTISCRIRGNANINLYRLNTGGNESTAWINRSELSTTNYKDFFLTFASPNSNKTMNQVYICTRYGTANSQIGDWFEIDPCSLKLELGNKATPWCPNSTDILYTLLGLDNNTVYDCSGNENNGTINNVTYSSDSKRYNSSAVFNGTNSYIKVVDNTWMPQYTQELTVTAWAYSSNYSSIPHSRMWSCTEGGGFNVEAGDSGYWRFSVLCATNEAHTSSTYKFNTTGLKLSDLTAGWHMFTWVFTTTNHYIYLDGELYDASEQTNYGLVFNTNARLYLGCEASGANPSSPYFNGQLSDFRIYATALSADQILELYQTSASADEDYNFYSYSYNELNQGNEIEYLYDLNKSSGTGNFYQDSDGLHLDQNVRVAHDYIPIDPTDKTYKYDILISSDAGNMLDIGWERYDVNKTSRSNSACVYVRAGTTELNHYRLRGIVDLSTDTVNPCAFIKLRILNKWTGSDSETNGTATIHYLSLKEYTNTTTQDMTPLNINKQGIVNTTDILEKDIGVSVSNVYELNSHNFYEY